MRQKGFATLEVILMVMVIGILASIAVPRFTDITAKANTAKIQADLSTIDTAIAIYEMEYGTPPSGTDVKDLVKAGYLQVDPQPPSGKCYMNGASASTDISTLGSAYTIGDVTVEGITTKRALLGTGNTAEKFYAPKKNSGSGETQQQGDGQG